MSELFAVNNSFYTPLNSVVLRGTSDFFLMNGDTYTNKTPSVSQPVVIPPSGTVLLLQLIITNNEGANINFGNSRFYCSMIDTENIFVDQNGDSAPILYRDVNFDNINLPPGDSRNYGFLLANNADNQLISLFRGPNISTTPTGNYATLRDMTPYKIYFSKRVGLNLKFRNNVVGRDFTATFNCTCIGVT